MKKKDIILIVLVLLLAGGFFLWRQMVGAKEGAAVRVTVNGEVYGVYSLETFLQPLLICLTIYMFFCIILMKWIIKYCNMM